ncbi:hypothetical protein HUG17_0184 [Dermatophagoides farinae]|nr:hypothetical protein HUG17_0184 [Dermatophagoides farinae]
MFIMIWYTTQEFYDFYLWLTNIESHSFDISGHVHVLILSNLFLQQEFRFLRQYLRRRRRQQKQHRQQQQQPQIIINDEIELARKEFGSHVHHHHQHQVDDIAFYPRFIQFQDEQFDKSKIDSMIDTKTINQKPSMNRKNESKSILWFDQSCLFIYLFTRFVSIIWDIILLQTAFFYHTTIEKLISLIWTVWCCHFLNSLCN